MKNDETLSAEEVCKILHISKRKCAWMLQNGMIPCKDTGKATHRYLVLRKDLDAYVKDSAEHPEKYFIPVTFTSKNPGKRETDKYYLYPNQVPEDFRPWLDDAWYKVPDVVTPKDVETILGYEHESVRRWINRGWLKITKERYIFMKCNVATKSTVVLTKEETKVKKICEFFDCRKICTYEDFVMALECGEYVIGGTLVPFNPQYVLHYDEGRFDVFEVEPSMKIHPRMKVKRLRTTISKHTVERCLEEESVPECDNLYSFLISPTCATFPQKSLKHLQQIPDIKHQMQLRQKKKQ